MLGTSLFRFMFIEVINVRFDGAVSCMLKYNEKAFHIAGEKELLILAAW
jgi:hypothetical protein